MSLFLYKKSRLEMAIFKKVVKIVAASTNSLICLKFMSFNFGNGIFTKSKISSPEMGLQAP